MDKIKELITNSLRYYDLNNEKYSRIFDKASFYSIIRSKNDLSHDVILLYDKNKNKIFKSRYEALGFYSLNAQLWSWAWSIGSYEKNLVYISRKILNYGLDIAPKEDPFLKSELITSRFRITNDIQLDIHAAIASYISKKPIVFKLISDPNLAIENELNIYELIKEQSTTSIIYFLFLLDENGINL